MGQTLENVGAVAHVADIVYSGEQMVLPNGMTIPDAMKLLKARQEYLEQPIMVQETFDAFPFDGAWAFTEVLRRRFGWAHSVPTPGFFGPTPPQMITIAIDVDKKVQVPWGSFEIPGVVGKLQTDATWTDKGVRFMIKGKILRHSEATIRSILEDVRQELKINSIYRGKAVRIDFTDQYGNRHGLPVVEFLRTDDVDKSMLIYSDHVQASINTNLFTPITRVNDCFKNGIAVKRGVLLGGVFGTGKTLAAKVASRLAVEHGITYVYVPRADNLPEAINFARLYQSPACVVFCEDIDRSTSGNRDVDMDNILNIIDGIDTKFAHIITVLTTNDMESINPAMLRPGRLDAVIEVTPPDSGAVQKLLRAYGKGAIQEDTDLTQVGNILAGCIPAVIAEVVQRAKLAELRRHGPGELITNISAEALIESAKTMQTQLILLNRKPAEPRMELDHVLNRAIKNAVQEVLTDNDLDQLEGFSNEVSGLRDQASDIKEDTQRIKAAVDA